MSPSGADAEEGESPGPFTLCLPLGSGVDGPASEGVSDCRKVTNTLTKPDGLYLGRQRGSQDADADEFTMDGECAVFIKM